ncbi:uncharacterized protein LOC129600482 [Paramacrobiotus metropolitanus]|uniref:uncharacterized protein LOC129600482 n=1 Tax=Paramacrobiotus metropolitanus TaxID=2943436 RepID=UPI002445DEFD|nr:uncharacterized protein LOC129600482 [Paramacrobiotus metropolitanus]XP_055354995.1 uncharacterized protein LOC129600482 [Paramacrobiotus metropolitanus]
MMQYQGCYRTRTIRPRGYLGKNVTPETFPVMRIPLPVSEPWCRDVSVGLKWLSRIAAFYTHWYCQTNTIFLHSDDQFIEVLSSHRNYDSPRTLSEAFKASLLPGILNYFQKFDERVHVVTDNLICHLVNAVTEAEVPLNSCEYRIDELPWDVQLTVFSFLDAYDQGRFKRLSSHFRHLSSAAILQECIVLPKYSSNVILDEGFRLNDLSSTFTKIIISILSRNTKVVYLTGSWEEILEPLSDILQILELKLNWLVVADNYTLQLGEFMTFPPVSHMLRKNHEKAYKTTWMPTPAYADMCHNVLLKNCIFKSNKSLCFRYACSHFTPTVDFGLLNCCTDPFEISISLWSYRFERSWATSGNRFHDEYNLLLWKLCPQLDDNKFQKLLEWLDYLKTQPENLGFFIWTFIELVFTMWRVEAPKDIAEVFDIVSNPKIQHCPLTHTLYLLVPIQPFA